MKLTRKLSEAEIIELVTQHPPLTTNINIINFVRELFGKATIRFGESPTFPEFKEQTQF